MSASLEEFKSLKPFFRELLHLLNELLEPEWKPYLESFMFDLLLILIYYSVLFFKLGEPACRRVAVRYERLYRLRE